MVGEAGPALPPEGSALLLPPQKKKGKEAGSGAALPPPRAPALPPEARGPHASSPAAAKRSKAKAKGKEVKKEVRLGGVLCSVDSGAHAWCARPPQRLGFPRSIV